MPSIRIITEDGELKEVVVMDACSAIYYEVEGDCKSCDRFRIVSLKDGKCFECDNPDLVKDMKIALGLDTE